MSIKEWSDSEQLEARIEHGLDNWQEAQQESDRLEYHECIKGDTRLIGVVCVCALIAVGCVVVAIIKMFL